MTSLEAIQAATINTAKLFGIEERVGKIEEGYQADIVGVSANPLDDISVLESTLFVMKKGKVYKKYPDFLK